MPEPNTFNYWLLLLLNGPGFVLNLSAIILVCWKKKRCYSALLLVPFLGMQINNFVETLQSKTCFWCLGLTVILSLATLIVASWWIWRSRRELTWQEMASNQKMLMVTAVIVSILILTSAGLRIMNGLNL